jgi:hypothetical protein
VNAERIMPPLCFNEQQSQKANEAWGANCGPHALAAACEITLDAARKLLLEFDDKRYTNPTMMEMALKILHRPNCRTRGLKIKTLPDHGLARIQWEGSWLDSNVPVFVAYRYTHWVASWGGYVFCTAMPDFGWMPEEDWLRRVTRLAEAQYKGWHVTHHYLLIDEAKS